MNAALFPLLLAGGLLAPGWLLGRALGTSAGFAGALLGSAALLIQALLALDALHLPLDRQHLAGAMAIVCLVLAALGRRRPASAVVTSQSPDTPPFRWQPHHALLVPAALGLGAITLKAYLEPLSGYDTTFRWDFLAQQLWREGTLAFYPAVTADDFLRYPWPDGIAPLISSLYFWCYLCADAVAPATTTPLVVGQALILFATVWQLAARRGGPLAGAVAAATLATSSVLLWGVALGQETGLTALALVAMFLFIERHRENRSAPWLIWAGLAAGTGALAREYGLAFIALGAFALAWQRVPRRGWLAFLTTATLVALPWYLRNAIKTGHPLYNHDLGPLFPTNPIGTEYLRIVSGFNGLGSIPGLPAKLGLLLLLLAGVPLVFGAIGGLIARRDRAPWLAALAVTGGLWLWSVGQTSGGATYSLRVLTPAIALGAALTGQFLAPLATTRRVPWLAAPLALLALDAGTRSLYLPALPKVAWWRPGTIGWHEIGQLATAGREQSIWSDLATAAESRGILVSDPAFYAVLVARGARPVPFFSPAVRFLFAPQARLADCLANLRAQNVRFILILRNNPVIDAQLSRYPFFRALQLQTPIVQTPDYTIFDLYAPALASPP